MVEKLFLKIRVLENEENVEGEIEFKGQHLESKYIYYLLGQIEIAKKKLILLVEKGVVEIDRGEPFDFGGKK